MKLGVFSVSMPEYNLQETVDILKELGYDGVEWRIADIPTSKPSDIPYERRYWIWNESTVNLKKIEELAPQLREMCNKANLDIIGFTTYLKPNQLEPIESVLRAANKVKVKQVRVFTDNYVYDNPNQKSYYDIFNETKANIKRIESLAVKYDVKVVFEIHHDNIFASASAAMRLIDGCDYKHIGLIVDPGNMVYEGYENYRKVFEILGPYVAHIHIKNARLDSDGRNEFGALKWKRVWAPIKEGMADMKTFFHELKATGYDGTISLEDFSNELGTKDKLRYSKEFILELWEKA